MITEINIANLIRLNITDQRLRLPRLRTRYLREESGGVIHCTGNSRVRKSPFLYPAHPLPAPLSPSYRSLFSQVIAPCPPSTFITTKKHKLTKSEDKSSVHLRLANSWRALGYSRSFWDPSICNKTQSNWVLYTCSFKLVKGWMVAHVFETLQFFLRA